MADFGNFRFYKLSVKLLTPMFGTATSTSIYEQHVLKKSQKEIAKANREKNKITKAVQKYLGDNISEDKYLKEIDGSIRVLQEYVGDVEPIPEALDDKMVFAKALEEVFEDIIKKEKESKPTCFLRAPNGDPVISSHMILGNIKENLKIITNNSTRDKDLKIAKSKVSVGEMMALDIKPIEEFMYPDMDIIRLKTVFDHDGSPMDEKVIRKITERAGSDLKPYTEERPIRFERMGKTETAIARSEVLPEGTEMSVNLRIRSDSTLLDDGEKTLRTIFDLGKSNGLGQWRGSGHKGAYCFKLEELEKDPTPIFEGWS